jgi:periplasmic protein CpxP/Spy
MNNLTKNKWFLFLLGFLLLANITLLLSFFVFGEKSELKPHNAPPQGAGYLYKELSFTEDQKAKHKELKEAHFKNIKPLWEEIRITKDSLYKQLNNPSFDEAALQEMTNRLAEKNKLSDQLMFLYFRELRTICTPDQLAKFDTIVPQMVNKRGGGWNKGGGHPVKK